jgi:hypothetical protein
MQTYNLHIFAVNRKNSMYKVGSLCIGVLMLLKYFLDIQTLNGLDFDLLNGLDFDLQQDQTSLICESVAFLN